MTLANLPPDLLTNRTAVLATNGHDGHPQLTAVWYIVEDDRICISITESTRKAKNLADDGRCSVLIFHPETPNYYAEIRGFARIEPDHDYVFADRLGQRYDADMRSFDSANVRRLRVAIEPLKVVVTDVRA
ncbi:MAG: PPOX class F420-dependent oxidoreductase [Acidimicrobiales bacterium]|nr:PPOX class F420-dependent oxidoreductase [Acidimicrobiales bacterium]